MAQKLVKLSAKSFPVTSAGHMVANDLQEALVELDSDKLELWSNLGDLPDPNAARVNISAAKSGNNSDITSLSNLNTPLSVLQGGTGANNATLALSNIGGTPSSIFTAHSSNSNNPHSVSKSQVGLGNVSNSLQLTAANNLSDLLNLTTARTNLGLGSAALSNALDFATSIHTHSADNIMSGTMSISRLPIATNGVSSPTTLVRADDSRLSDARTPSTHTQSWSTITNTPTTLTGYGITNGLLNTNNLSDLDSTSQARTNLGLGSASLQSASAFVAASHTTQADAHAISSITGLQTTLDSKLNVNSYTIDLGGKYHTRGVSPPASPNIGDTFDELDSTGLIGEWFWNGSMWLSRQIFTHNIPLFNISAQSNTFYMPVKLNSNLYLLDIVISYSITGTSNTSTIYWNITLGRLTSPLVQTTIDTVSTSSASGNTIIWVNKNLNLWLNVISSGTKALYLTVSKVSTPSNITVTYLLNYRLARI